MQIMTLKLYKCSRIHNFILKYRIMLLLKNNNDANVVHIVMDKMYLL